MQQNSLGGLSDEEFDRQSLSTSSSLIVELQQLAPERWRLFVRLYAPLLLYWLRRYGVPDAQRDDVLQECLISIFSGIQRFSRNDAGGSFRGWLRTIVQRRVADYRRSTPGTQVTLQVDLAHFPAPSASDDNGEGERKAFEDLRGRAMELARQNCTENSWQMFWQTVVESRPTADVATEFAVSPAAVRMARGRVLSVLRQYLIDDFRNAAQ